MFRSRDDDERVVTEALREIATHDATAPKLPDPSFLWWKGQLLRRIEAEREASAPVAIGEHVHVGAAVLGAVALAAGAWDHLPSLSLSVETGMTVGLALAVLLIVAAVAAVDALRHR